MNRALAILLALSMFVPSLVPSAAAQTGDQPPVEIEPPVEEPEQPTIEDQQVGTYFEHGFDTIAPFTTQRMPSDRTGETLWHTSPLGRNGSMAATLRGTQGLPSGVHQALVSPSVDLTPVPGARDDGTADRAGELGAGTADTAARGGAAAGTSVTRPTRQASGPVTDNEAVRGGEVSLPQGPAYLTVIHRFAFDDSRNEQDQAVSGFTIEARTEGGQWTPLEPVAVAETARGTAAPSTSQTVQEGVGKATGSTGTESVDPCQPVDILNGFTGFSVFGISIPTPQAPCELTPQRIEQPPGSNEALFELGETIDLSPVGTATDSPVPSLPNAYIQPLDARGFTGDSGDQDEDGKPDLVGHVFDLSPWAGEETDLRFRAGTSAVGDVPTGLWSIDRVQVQAGARTADLRLQLEAPAEDHLAVPGETFPTKARIQNVGLAEQPGPFNVNLTVTREGSTVIETTVTAPGPLSFLESTVASFPLPATEGAPYDISARLEPSGPDTEPRNDVEAARLPVGQDTTVDLQVIPNATVVQEGDLITATVIAEAQGNLPLFGDVQLTAFPYDPQTRSPVRSGAQAFSQQTISLPADGDRHPLGVDDAKAAATFQRTLEAGSYLLVAQFNDATAQAPLGVGTAPPPIMVDRFESVSLGETTFEVDGEAGTWQVNPGSDVIRAPLQLDPGTRETGGTWAPTEHEEALFRACGDEIIAHGSVPVRELLSSQSDKPARCDGVEGAGGSGGDRGSGGSDPGDTSALDPLLGFCLLGVGPCLVEDDVRDLRNQTGQTVNRTVIENLPPRAGIYLESPEGSQRVYGMAHDVRLDDVSRAKLRFISSLVTPPDGSGLTEARLYVSTKQDTESVVDQITDPDNCPEDGPCEIVNRATAPLNLADPLVDVAFQLESELRCDAIPNLLRPLGGDDDDDAGTVEETYRTTVKGVSCPATTGSSAATGACTGYGVSTVGEAACFANERSRFEVLMGLMSGDLVWQDTTGNPWQWEEIDLSQYAGQNVTLTFIFLADTQHTTETFEIYGAGQNSKQTLGYGAPDRPKGTFLLDRVTVETDRGVRLAPSNTTLASSAAAETAANTAQENRPGTTADGWRTMGYLRFSGLGPEQMPLRSSAQFIVDDGRPGATGAEPSQGLSLGVIEGDQKGVRLYSNVSSSSTTSNPRPTSLDTPLSDAAVTVLASPEIDLRGLQAPQIQFNQRFDLTTETGPQPAIGTFEVGTLASALGLTTEQAVTCSVGNGEKADLEVKVTLRKLACLLDEARREDPDLDIQNEVVLPEVTSPPVSAGLYLQARHLTEDGWSDPVPVSPERGYRYPIDDPGAYAPRLNYTVETKATFPGYTTANTCQATLPCNQPTFQKILESKHNEQRVWAGDSDVDGDEEADWISSEVDLTQFEDEVVRLEFVLVTRNPSSNDQLTRLPWQIDDISVTEGKVEGQVALHELQWPSQQLPRLAQGEDLPIRLSVTTPTGLDDEVHARATLVDADGCFRGTATTTGRFTDAAGRPQPMPPGATLDLPEMVIPGQNVTGASPWSLQIALDTGRTPVRSVDATVTADPVQGTVVEHAFTEALDVGASTEARDRPRMNLTTTDPDCRTDPRLVVVTAPDGVPITSIDDELDQDNLGFQVVENEEGDLHLANATSTTDDQHPFNITNGVLSTGQGDNERGLPALVAVLERHDQRADGVIRLVHNSVPDETALVKAPGKQAPVDTPVPITVRPSVDTEDAILWSIPLNQSGDEPQDAEILWRGSLSAAEEREITVEIPGLGPHMVVMTGTADQDDQARDLHPLGGTLVVAVDARPGGDPTLFDNLATLTASEGVTENLIVKGVTVDPPSGLSTQPRRIVAHVQNAGNTVLEDLDVVFTANGDQIKAESRDRMLPGAVERFTIPEFEPGGDPAVVIRVKAESGDLTASNAAPLRSLIDLGGLTPTLNANSTGWNVQGTTATFEDPETGKAPQDTVGTVGLAGARLEGLADVALNLDHVLDMEQGFDGGQAILSKGDNIDVLQAGPNMQEMGPYSPIQGEACGVASTAQPCLALTGQRNTDQEPVALDTKRFLGGELETIQDEDAASTLATTLFENPEEDLETRVTCESRIFIDDALETTDGPRCAWSQPMIPVPREAARDGIWHLQPGSILSPTSEYEVIFEGETYTIEADGLTQYLMLEAGSDLVKAAQQAGSLTLTFDEARALQVTNTADRGTLTIQACARFVDLQPASNGEGYGSVETGVSNPVVVRCAGLTHDEPQEENLPWSQTTLRFGDTPKGDFDIVRFEFALQEDRGFEGGGILNDATPGDDSRNAERLENAFKGWFIGDVSASAGGVTESWDPDPEALDKIDPMSGLTADELAQKDKLRRFVDVNEQFSLVDASEVRVNGKLRSPITSLGLPGIALPLASCQWWRVADECAFAQLYDDYTGSTVSPETQVLATLPYALGLSCFQPSNTTLAIDTASFPHTACDDRWTTGLGPQVITPSLLARTSPGLASADDIPCETGTSETVGQPLFWRTRCLHTARIVDEDDAVGNLDRGDLFTCRDAEDFRGLRFTSDDMAAQSCDEGAQTGPDEDALPPVRARGYGLDYRLILPADLRFVSDSVWATPDIEIPHAAQGNRLLGVTVRAEARIEGTQAWTPVDFCDPQPDGRCLPHWSDGRPALNLTPFIGQRVEIALRVDMPHPSLQYDDVSGVEGILEFHGLKVEGGYVRMIGPELGLRAWTDPSIQGEGWTVNNAQLFGLPIEANVGLGAFTSRMAVHDDIFETEVLHVHTNETADDDLYMQIPAKLTLYNQGNEPRTMGLEGSVADRDGRTNTACQVDIEILENDGSTRETVEMGPGTSQRLDLLIHFTPKDREDGFTGDDDDEATPEDCFPREVENQGTAFRPKVNKESYQLRINLTDDSLPEGDYVGTDNRMSRELRATPFLRHGSGLSFGEHAPRLSVANLTVDPTRPSADQPVQVTADLSLRDEIDRPVKLELHLLEPRERTNLNDAPERTIGVLTGSEADVPINSLKPYRTQTVQWTLTDDQVPENLTLVRLVTEIDRGGQPIGLNETAWLAKGSVADDRRAFEAVRSFNAGEEMDFDARNTNSPQRTACRFDSDGSDCADRYDGDAGSASAAIWGTDWQEMEATAPPVVAIKARWAFPQTDDPRFTPQDEIKTLARSGWTVQVCHADERQDGVCPIDADAGTDASGWQTVSVSQVPRNTLGVLKGNLLPPGECSGGSFTQPDATSEDAEKCSSAAQPWSGFDLKNNGNTRGGEPVVTGTSPGFALDPFEEGAWSTVLASATECTHGTDLEQETCVDWGDPEVRGDVFKFRVIVFTTPEIGIPQTLTIDEMTLAPVGLDMTAARSTAGHDIPEAATKAVPLRFTTAGALGARVDPVTEAPSGWETSFETLGADSAVEDDADDRFLIEAPISPSGVSQSALLSPKLLLPEDPLRTATTLVPVGVQAGLHPDLAVTRVSTPKDITEGEDVLVEAHVVNRGLSESPPVDVVGAARYSDGNVDLLSTVDDKQLPGLAPGAGATIVLKWRPSKAGDATLRVAADLDRHAPITGAVIRDWGQGELPELQECTQTACNNVGTARVAVTPPPVADTRVEARVLADTPLPMGEPVDVVVSVTNDGPATVPAFRVRLLAGVISLLDDDPLVVNEPLAPGETWSQTVELVPGNSGNLSLVATAFSDERLVQEARGLRPDGTLKEADNVQALTVPVVARGLGVDMADAVKAKDLVRSGQLAVPIDLENRGSEPLVVSVAARAAQGLGTLVDDAGEVGGTVGIAPGESSTRELRVLYDELPGSGQHDLDVQIASQAGVEKRRVTVEVPAVVDLEVDPVSVQARAGKVVLPVTVHGQGNAPTTAQISLQSLALTPVTKEIQVSPGDTVRTNITAWLTHQLDDVATGTITVRAGEVVRKAPLRVTQAPGSAPTIHDVQLVPGNTPTARANISNLGDQATEVDVSLVQGNLTLANTTTRLSAGQIAGVSLPATPTPGTAELRVQDTVTGEILSRHLRVAELRPDLHLLELRTRPLAPQAGETVSIQATLANDGGSPVTVTPGLYVDGTLYTTTAEAQRLAPGAVEQVTFQWEATAGEHSLVVDADPLDQIDDVSQQDDAKAAEVRVAEASTADDLTNAVPALPVGLIVVALVAVAWARRERTG